MFDLTSTGGQGRPPVPAEPSRGRIDTPIGGLDEGPDWRRAIAALRRHIWMIIVATGLAGVAGWYASRMIAPLYEAHATIWIDEGNRRTDRSPLAPSDLFDAQGWAELLTSNAVLDTVVAQLHLFVRPDERETRPEVVLGNHGNRPCASGTIRSGERQRRAALCTARRQGPGDRNRDAGRLDW